MEAEEIVTTSMAHRAEYILERGIWRATCKVCGWGTSDPARRQAAALFRQHWHTARAQARVTIDLRDADRSATAVPQPEVALGQSSL